MRFIELFAGIGGFRYGLESVGWLQQTIQERQISKNTKEQRRMQNSRQFTCVYANEWNKYACQIYRKNFGKRMFDKNPEVYKATTKVRDKKGQFGKQFNGGTEGQYDCSELQEEDITRVPTDSIPDHDLLTAGFPCPTYSIAGKRKGFEDPRGVVFFEICRIAKVKRPRLLLLENVKGLLNHDKGRTFRIILDSLSELGYDCEWEVLNSKNFGVPQNRERVFIVGHLRRKGGQKIFPIGKGNQIFIEKQNKMSYSTAITGNYRKGVHSGGETYINENVKIRRLTPIECERLQGFPDGWTKGISDTQRYKCLGNAVTINVIREIGRKLIND